MTTEGELDRLAKSYYLDPPADVWLEERVQTWIMPHLLRQCRGAVLEMGLGTGLVIRGLCRAGVNVEVVEGSSALWAEAIHDPEIRCPIHHRMFEEFTPGEIYDTVLCLHVLEHLDDPVAMLERIRGWLRPGGTLVAVTPNATSIHRLAGALMTGEPPATLSERDRVVGHRRVYTVGELCDDLAAGGFDTAGGVFGWFLKPANNARLLDYPPNLIDALCEVGWRRSPFDAANIGVVARRA